MLLKSAIAADADVFDGARELKRRVDGNFVVVQQINVMNAWMQAVVWPIKALDLLMQLVTGRDRLALLGNKRLKCCREFCNI